LDFYFYIHLLFNNGFFNHLSFFVFLWFQN